MRAVILVALSLLPLFVAPALAYKPDYHDAEIFNLVFKPMFGDASNRTYQVMIYEDTVRIVDTETKVDMTVAVYVNAFYWEDNDKKYLIDRFSPN